MQDRRSGNERRSSNRFPVEVDVEWESAGTRQSGTISDVSLDGCFVLGSGEVTDGDAVKLFVPLADGMKVQFDGVVANNVFEIGFGVRFAQVNAAQRDVLMQLVKQSGG